MGAQALTNYTRQISFLKRAITFADNGVVLKMGTIPAGANIIKPMSGVHVDVVFNAGTTNVLDIGTAADGDFYATDLALGTIGHVALDEAVTMSVTADTDITATVALAGTAATTGSGVVIIAFMT